MMTDLISRKAAIDALEREKTYCTAFRDGYTPVNVFEKYNAGLTDGIKALKNLPSVEPKRGKWLKIVDLDTVQCSECFEEFDYIDGLCYLCHGQELPNYCPNCGARMDGKEQKGEIK